MSYSLLLGPKSLLCAWRHKCITLCIGHLRSTWKVRIALTQREPESMNKLSSILTLLQGIFPLVPQQNGAPLAAICTSLANGPSTSFPTCLLCFSNHSLGSLISNRGLVWEHFVLESCCKRTFTKTWDRASLSE